MLRFVWLSQCILFAYLLNYYNSYENNRISQRTICTFLICINQLLFGQSPPPPPPADRYIKKWIETGKIEKIEYVKYKKTRV